MPKKKKVGAVVIQELFKLPPFVSVILKKEAKKFKILRRLFCYSWRKVGISLDIKSSKVVHVCHFKWVNGFEGLDFYILATDWEGELHNLEPEKHEEPKWFNLNNLPHNIAPNHQKALEEINKKVFYSELGWK